jgi:hypothetical protein
VFWVYQCNLDEDITFQSVSAKDTAQRERKEKGGGRDWVRPERNGKWRRRRGAIGRKEREEKGRRREGGG